MCPVETCAFVCTSTHPDRSLRHNFGDWRARGTRGSREEGLGCQVSSGARNVSGTGDNRIFQDKLAQSEKIGPRGPGVSPVCPRECWRGESGGEEGPGRGGSGERRVWGEEGPGRGGSGERRVWGEEGPGRGGSGESRVWGKAGSGEKQGTGRGGFVPCPWLRLHWSPIVSRGRFACASINARTSQSKQV